MQITADPPSGGNAPGNPGVVHGGRRDRSASERAGGCSGAGAVPSAVSGGARGGSPLSVLCRTVPQRDRDMMGHSHALSGAVIWLAAAPALAGIPALGGLAAGAAPLMWNALTPAELVAGAVI